MNYTEQVEKYLEYCEFRKELDWNTLKAYRIDLRSEYRGAEEPLPLPSGSFGHSFSYQIPVFPGISGSYIQTVCNSQSEYLSPPGRITVRPDTNNGCL